MARPWVPALAATLLATALAVGSAHAQTLERDGTTVRYTAGPGERNEILVTAEPWGLEISDHSEHEATGEMTYAALDDECTRDRATPVSEGKIARRYMCPGPIERFVADLRDRNDSAHLYLGNYNDRYEPDGITMVAHGGPGSDALHGGHDRSELYGGDGDDYLQGGAGNDHLDAGPGFSNIRAEAGNDHIVGGGSTIAWGGQGDDVIEAGTDGRGNELFGENSYANPAGAAADPAWAGDDVLIGHGASDHLDGQFGTDAMSGGDGADGVSYRSHDGVRVSLNGVADDGADGEADSIAADVEVVSGSPGSDTLTGGPGNEQLVGLEGHDRIVGADGDDVLVGMAGDDTMDGGAGFDKFRAFEGDDSLDSREPEGGRVDPEELSCGDGDDFAAVDARDMPSGCERVEQSGAPWTIEPFPTPAWPVVDEPPSRPEPPALEGTPEVSLKRGLLTMRFLCRNASSPKCKGTASVATDGGAEARRRFSVKQGRPARVIVRLPAKLRREIARRRKVKAMAKLAVRALPVDAARVVVLRSSGL